MRRFIIPDLSGSSDEIRISGAEAHHIIHVVRLKVDTHIILFNGKGFEVEARIESITDDALFCRILKRNNSDTNLHYPLISLSIGFLKEKKIDDLIRPLTELGVTHLNLFPAKRSVSRPKKDKLIKKAERWQKLSQEALKQCGRNIQPEINMMDSLSDVLKTHMDWPDKFIFYESETEPFSHLVQKCSTTRSQVSLIIGPEGGFEPDEIDEAKIYHYKSASLGPYILKAETAAITVAGLSQLFFGNLG